jgi:predicted nucleic acid-binding protein
VDCLSFVVMEKLGISEALAVDDDFTHHFVARPGPLKR